jgi:hypothetical protein
MRKRDRDRQEKPDPSKIFVQAHRFFRAGKILYEMTTTDELGEEELQIPAGMLYAFACELFLKCLICIEKGYSPHGHDLRILFNKLTPSTRKRLEEVWNQYATTYADRWIEIERNIGCAVARDLPSALAAGSKAFDLIRYRHEDRPIEFKFYLGAFPHMLGKVAFELKPEWATILKQDVKDGSQQL